MYENKKSLLILPMPNIFSYVKVAETVCGCLQEARAEVRNSVQSRDYLHVCKNHADERLWDHWVSQKDKVIHSSPQSSWGSWKPFLYLTCVLCLSVWLWLLS